MDSEQPPRGLLARLAQAALRLAGWRVDFAPLPGPRGIVIVYPHTSNWDFIVGLLAKWALGIPFRWVGKESLFRGLAGATLGRLMRRWGGMPVNRHDAQGAVEQLAALIEAQPWCWLAMSPEGTRSYRDSLRSGFYFLALRLDVPVGFASFDYRDRCVRCSEFHRMSGDIDRDLAVLRAAYRDTHGLMPANASRIALHAPQTRR